MTMAMTMIFTLVCCAALAPVALCGKVAISNISKEQIKNIGEQVEFNCTVQNNDDNYKVFWFKFTKDGRDQVPLATDGETTLRDNRFHASYDKQTSTYSFRIDKLQESDTGFYQCQIIISVSEVVSANVELQIRRPPTISQNTTQSVNVTEGWPFELHCYADGFPVPRISWKRDDDLLLSTGGVIFRGNVLKIQLASKDDRGLYYCVAENGVGSEARANASVRVEFQPVVLPVRPRVGQAPGYDVGLECKIEAYPAPMISWYKNGEELKRQPIKSSADKFVDTLQRYSVGSSDYGEYICRAENKHGRTETRIDLFETIVPVCTSSCG
ncbi:lachesin-like [Phymastichus coffea]|uniref:lachesin-like n=1 Tax=Phymastichus coffea TaxID=108790 RepID=UPI00273B2604|nr:lachesin-like [Phymastichus coffea]